MCPNIGKEIFIKTEIGLWIDHRKAVVVIISDEVEEVREISSKMEKHVRYSNDTSEDGSSEDVRDRQYKNHLNNFYDAVIVVIRDRDSVQIFGPGEAKGELKKRLESEEFKGHILATETVDKMTTAR